VLEPGKWIKSTWSCAGDCVEVMNTGDEILVRNSRDRNGPQVSYTHKEWEMFTAGARDGEFDL
jgi:hypothetical protein